MVLGLYLLSESTGDVGANEFDACECCGLGIS